MNDSLLIIKSKKFALEIIKVCNIIKQSKKESVLTNQLIRSGTSVGANIREAFYAHSKEKQTTLIILVGIHFISKLSLKLHFTTVKCSFNFFIKKQ